MMRATLVLVTAAVALVTLPSQAAPATGETPRLGGSSNLGDGLLLDGLDDLIGAPKSTEPSPQRSVAPAGDAPAWLPNRKELQQRMQDSLDGKSPMGQGEDLGESPLVALRSTMDKAGSLLAAGDEEGQTRPTQEEVITRLDDLIKQMEKQCQNCKGGGQDAKPKPQQSKRSKPSQSEQQKQQAAKKTKPGKPQSNRPAQQSTARLTQAEAAAAAAQRNQEVIKRVWGRLPERLREQMLQSTTDEFLPEYREEIEQYFQRLAEEED